MTLAAADAGACPVCASRGGTSGADAVLIAIMLMAPVLLVGVGYLSLRVLWRPDKERKP